MARHTRIRFAFNLRLISAQVQKRSIVFRRMCLGLLQTQFETALRIYSIRTSDEYLAFAAKAASRAEGFASSVGRLIVHYTQR